MEYFISDLHINHAKIIEYDARPFADVEEMNRVLIENWNNVVNEDDIVFHLGDFSVGGAVEWTNLLDQLHGRIFLILGNHDNHSLKDRRFSILFDEIVPYKEITDNTNGKNYNLVLSHYPIFSWNKC